jgi:hypothetical protein
MIFIFPKSGHVDWNRVREHCSSWESSPLLFDKDQPQFAGDFAVPMRGCSQAPPDGRLTAATGAEVYLGNFYKTMQNEHPDTFAVGGAWPGFDDSAAKWGLNRHMQALVAKRWMRLGIFINETTMRPSRCRFF